MREYDFDACLERYKKFRDENCVLIKELNEKRKEIRFLMQFDKDSVEQVIQRLHEQSTDLEDTAEVLGIPSWDLYFLLKEKTKGGVVCENFKF